MGDNERKLNVALGVLIGSALERGDIRQVIGIYPSADAEVDNHGYTIAFELLDPAADEVVFDVFENEVAELDREGLDAWVHETLTNALGEDDALDDDEEDDAEEEEVH